MYRELGLLHAYSHAYVCTYVRIQWVWVLAPTARVSAWTGREVTREAMDAATALTGSEPLFEGFSCILAPITPAGLCWCILMLLPFNPAKFPAGANPMLPDIVTASMRDVNAILMVRISPGLGRQ